MTAEEKRSYLLRFHRFQKSREKFFAPLIFRAIRSQYNYFISLIQSGHTEHSALTKISSSVISDVLKPLYLDAATIYGAKVRSDLLKLRRKELKARLPMGFSETMRALIEQYFSIDILNSSEGITQTTKDLISKVFTEAYALGEGVDDIVKKLENTELSRIRSRLIARTESVTAANAGALIVAKDTGMDLKKEWLSASDNRVRLHHRHLNGQIVELNNFFHDDGVTMQVPGARVQENGLPVPASFVVNCRCTTIFIPQD